MNSDDYIHKCDICHEIKSCPFQVDAVYCYWTLCEECHREYSQQFIDMDYRDKNRIIREYILMRMKQGRTT